MAKKPVPSPFKIIRETKREFIYKKNTIRGELNLSFTLRTDIPEQLVAFRELMKCGIADMDEELAKHGITE